MITYKYVIIIKNIQLIVLTMNFRVHFEDHVIFPNNPLLEYLRLPKL